MTMLLVNVLLYYTFCCYLRIYSLYYKKVACSKTVCHIILEQPCTSCVCHVS